MKSRLSVRLTKQDKEDLTKLYKYVGKNKRFKTQSEAVRSSVKMMIQILEG